jgi:hypothetical protein
MKIKETRSILATIDKATDGIEYTSSERSNLFMALFDVSMEHAKSIIILIEHGKFGSAYALARPLLETFIRAAWIQNCATEIEVERLAKRDKIKKNFGVLIEEVERKTGWPDFFSWIKDNILKNMHSYTHGGKELAARRFKGDKLVHMPDVGEINALCRLSAIISFLCLTSVAESAEIPDIDNLAMKLNHQIKTKLL